MQILIMTVIGLVVAAALFIPFGAHRTREYDWDGTAFEARLAERREAVEAGVRHYRESLRAGTVCPRCIQANPPGSRYCMDCGRELPSAAPPAARVVAEPAAP